MVHGEPVNRSIRYLARAQVRRRWRSLLLIALLAGLVGGLSISLVAGSQRSSTVVDRFVGQANQYDLIAYSPDFTEAMREDISALPGVVRADPDAFLAFNAVAPDGTLDPVLSAMQDPSTADPTMRVLEGELPDGSDPSQIVVNGPFAAQFGVTVGDVVDLQPFGLEQFEAVGAGDYTTPTGPVYPFTVAAIVRLPIEIASEEAATPGANRFEDASSVVVPDTWYWEHHDEFLDFGPAYYVELDERTTSIDEVGAAMTGLLPPGAEFDLGSADMLSRTDSLRSPVSLETTSLLALGLGVALTGIAAVALLLRAAQRDHDGDSPTLRALGCARSDVALAAGVRVVPAALTAGVTAAVSAVLLSGRYPIGIGRLLELDSGIEVNPAVVGIGAATVTLTILVLAVLLGRPPRERQLRVSGPATLSRWLARSGAPQSTVLGTHFAFSGRDARSGIARTAVFGGAVALAVVTATAVFVGGVDALYSQPSRHGWPWDAVVGNTNFALDPNTLNALLEDERVDGLTTALTGTARVDGTTAFLVAIDPSGTAPPIATEGRLPSTSSEIALGPALQSSLGADIGDTVTLSIAQSDFRLAEEEPEDRILTVVGQAALPSWGDGDMGEDAVITFEGLQAAGASVAPRVAMLQLGGADPSADIRDLDRALTEEIYTDLIPARVVNLHRVRTLPLVGLLLAGTLGTFVLAFTLSTGVRSRLRDLAVLRMLGMEARRLRRVLAWQGLALAGAMLVIGLPLGLAAGAAWWRSVAGDLGVSTSPAFPVWLWLLVPMTGLMAVVASAYPGWKARRKSPADLFRIE